jgi:hypothetical protein
MSIKQNALLQIRRGLQQNLPQLAGGELGFSVDEQRVFIGNGSFSEGAPTEGMTEIITATTLYNIFRNLGIGNALTGGTSIQSTTLNANVSTPVATGVVVLSPNNNAGFMDYTLLGNGQSRVGRIEYAVNVSDALSFSDEYIGDLTGIVFSGSIASDATQIYYTSANVSNPVIFSVYITSGAGTVVAPPAPPSPVAQIDVVAYSASPIFDAKLGQIFNITLTGDVTSSTFVNGLLGQAIVTFRIIQDGTGNHEFTWPDNVFNGGIINPGPNIVSTQSFALNTDGSLNAIGAISY